MTLRLLVVLLLTALPSSLAADDAAQVQDVARLAPDGPMDRPAQSKPAARLAFPTVKFRWPLRMPDWWHTSNYVDLDAGPGVLDYFCQSASYNGHQGTDIIIRDFYEQDEGPVPVVAIRGLKDHVGRFRNGDIQHPDIIRGTVSAGALIGDLPALAVPDHCPVARFTISEHHRIGMGRIHEKYLGKFAAAPWPKRRPTLTSQALATIH